MKNAGFRSSGMKAFASAHAKLGFFFFVSSSHFCSKRLVSSSDFDFSCGEEMSASLRPFSLHPSLKKSLRYLKMPIRVFLDFTTKKLTRKICAQEHWLCPCNCWVFRPPLEGSFLTHPSSRSFPSLLRWNDSIPHLNSA